MARARDAPFLQRELDLCLVLHLIIHDAQTYVVHLGLPPPRWGWNSGSRVYEASILPLSYSQFAESFLVFFPPFLSSGLKIDSQGTINCKDCQKSSHVCSHGVTRTGEGNWGVDVGCGVEQCQQDWVRASTAFQPVLKKEFRERKAEL